MVRAGRLARRAGPDLRDDRRRRAAGGPDLGVARHRGQRRHGRDHRHRRPQQDPVGHLGLARSATSATCRASSRPSAGTRRAATATTSRRSERRSTSCAPVTDRPKVIIADTIKGRGVSFMEGRAPAGEKFYRFHSGAPDDDDLRAGGRRAGRRGERHARRARRDRRSRSSRTPAPSGPTSQGRAAAGPGLLAGAGRPGRARRPDRRARRRPRARHRADPVRRALPRPVHRVRDRRAGHGLPGRRAGAAAASCRSCTRFACFLSTRPNEQIYNNATERRKVVYVGSLAGLLPGRPGPLAPVGARHLRPARRYPGSRCCSRRCEDGGGAGGARTVWTSRRRAVTCGSSRSRARCRSRCRGTIGCSAAAGVALTEGDDAVLFGVRPGDAEPGLAGGRAAARAPRVRAPGGQPALAQSRGRRLAGRRSRRRCGPVHPRRSLRERRPGRDARRAAGRARARARGAGPALRRVGKFPACGQNDEVLRAHRLDAESLAQDIAAALAEAAPD